MVQVSFINPLLQLLRANIYSLLSSLTLFLVMLLNDTMKDINVISPVFYAWMVTSSVWMRLLALARP